jgi:uncharacterized protein YukE
MATNRELFINPEQIRECARRITVYSSEMQNTLNDIDAKIQSTEAIFVAESATALREQFQQMKSYFEKFDSYLNKVASYLNVNVADPAEITDRVAQQNVAAIKKPS